MPPKTQTPARARPPSTKPRSARSITRTPPPRQYAPKKGEAPDYDPTVVEATSRCLQIWLEKGVHLDPIHKNMETFLAYQKAMGGKEIQPHDHCNPDHLPTVAVMFGLKREHLDPKSPYFHRLGNLTCIVAGVRLDCHKGAIPGFLWS